MGDVIDLVVYRYSMGDKYPLETLKISSKDRWLVAGLTWFKDPGTHRVFATRNGKRVFLKEILKKEGGTWIHANADPDMANSRRGSTIVPQQALFFMNNPLSVEVARAVAAKPEVVKAITEDSRINAMFLNIFQRRATSSEIRWAREFLDKQKALAIAAQRATNANAKPGATATKTAATKATTKDKSKTVTMNDDMGGGMMGKKDKPMGGKSVDAPDAMMMSVSTGGAEGVLQNVGEMVSRAPLTPLELLAQALLLSNEFVYVN